MCVNVCVSVYLSVCLSVCLCVCLYACVHVCVCMCVYPPPRLLIANGMMWHDMDPIRLVKQVLQLLYGNCGRYC